MARYGLSLASLEEGDFADAEKYLQQVIEKFPDKPVLLSDMAIIHVRQGNFDKAIQWQEKVVEMSKGDAKSGEEELLKLFKAKSPFRFLPPTNQ